MPKKTRREKERASRRRATGEWSLPEARPIEMPAPGTDTLVMPRTVESRAPVRTSSAVSRMLHGDFDYSYVYSDLRRIGILAALAFGAMIVLTFILK